MTILEKIKHFFDRHIALTESDDTVEYKLKVASAALMMEMLHTENGSEEIKHRLILGLLETSFSLDEQHATALIEIAEQRRLLATDYFEFTHLICDAYNHSQKIRLIEALWQVALSDERIDIEEEYLVDKVARLLFIPHVEMLQAKNRVRESLRQ